MYYQQTPISEKPEKEGYYHGFFDGSPTYDYFNGTEWRGDMSHWLKPITGVVMTEEEFERLYDGIVQNIETSVKRSDMPTWEQVLEMIKRDQIH